MKSIAVIGSASPDLSSEIRETAFALGQEIAKQGFALLTGAARGVGCEASRGAKQAGGRTIGISPASGKTDAGRYCTMEDYLDSVIYTGMGYKGRNVILIRSCHGVIAVNGGFGTLNELTIAQGESKPIVVLANTGGASSVAQELFDQLDPGYKLFAAAIDCRQAVIRLREMIGESP